MRVYLLAGWPSLSFSGKAPFPYEALFLECARHLSADDLAELDAVCAEPPEGSTPFARDWAAARRQIRAHNDRERLSRLPPDAARAPAPPSDEPFDALRGDLQAAWAEADPLRREESLLRARWNWIEERRRAAPYTLADLLGYALQLRLLERRDGWEEPAGRAQFDEHIHAFLDPVIEEVRTQELPA